MSPPSAREALAPWVVATALALLLGLQPVTTDLYLPALPTLAIELAAPMSAVQLTMSALILAFGIAQLAWGPVADRWGRRPVLLAGLTLFCVSSLCAAWAPGIDMLVLWRVVQGAALAAAVVCARAMVRDLYEPYEGAKVMARGLSGLGLIAMGSPLLGGWVSTHGGWRGSMVCVGLVGLATAIFVLWWLPETLPQPNPQATRIGPWVRRNLSILRQPTFAAWTSLIACTYGGLFTLLAASSFAYIESVGLSAAQYGAALASGSVAYFVGTLWCRRWLVRHGLAGAVKRGVVFTLAGGLLFAAGAMADVVSVWTLLIPQWLYAFGHGVHQPCGQAGAVGPFPQSAGVASALAGFILALTAFVVGLWLGQALDGTVRPMAMGIAFWALLTSLVGWTLVQRHGQTPKRPASVTPRT